MASKAFPFISATKPFVPEELASPMVDDGRILTEASTAPGS